MIRSLREIRGALAEGLLAMRARPRNALLTAAGFLIAAATLLGLLTIPAGLARLAGHTGRADVAVVLTSHDMSEITGGTNAMEDVALIGNLPGVARDAQGQALVAPQLVVSARLRRFDGVPADVSIRGVTPVFWQVVGNSATLVNGRMFQPGVDELIAGVGAARGFVALGTGAHVLIRKTPWKVMGQFRAGGGMWQSELWTSLGSLQEAWNASNRVSTIWVRLTSPAAFAAFKDALATNVALRGLPVERQTAYYRFQVGFIYRFARIAAWGVGALLGIAAALAIANSLNVALHARRREMAVLRAIGFRQVNLALALLVEVVTIGIACACVAIALGSLILAGHNISSSTFFQSVDFSLQLGASVAWETIAYTVLLGIVAAILPIARAVRAPLTAALQDE